jgi:hypothetical protein
MNYLILLGILLCIAWVFPHAFPVFTQKLREKYYQRQFLKSQKKAIDNSINGVK